MGRQRNMGRRFGQMGFMGRKLRRARVWRGADAPQLEESQMILFAIGLLLFIHTCWFMWTMGRLYGQTETPHMYERAAEIR